MPVPATQEGETTEIMEIKTIDKTQIPNKHERRGNSKYAKVYEAAEQLPPDRAMKLTFKDTHERMTLFTAFRAYIRRNPEKKIMCGSQGLDMYIWKESKTKGEKR